MIELDIENKFIYIYGIVWFLHLNSELDLHLMIKYLLLIVIFSFSGSLLMSQNKVVVIGKITDKVSGEGIEGAHIKVQQQNIVANTDKDGNYRLSFYRKGLTTLVYSHTSYEINYEPINLEKDTVYLNVKLNRKTAIIPEFVVENELKPTIVFKSAKISVADYEFSEEYYLFLAYKKRLNKNSELYLVDKNENIISKHFVPGEPVELYTDYRGNINLICKNYIYRVTVVANKIQLYELPTDEFKQLIKPIVDTLEKNLLFSDFLEQFPRFKYYAFDTKDSTSSLKVIKEVVHKAMDHQYSFEYYNLNNAEKQFAKQMAKRLDGYDRYDVAASMTGFANSFFYEEVYAPLFVVNDTIHIFDHYENKIWKFIEDTIEAGTTDFNYHQPKRRSEWKRQLIMDEVTGYIYGVFKKGGFYYLKKINRNTGKVDSEKKLSFQFVSKIKIKDGYVYYTYKKEQSLSKKFLYKEKI